MMKTKTMEWLERFRQQLAIKASKEGNTIRQDSTAATLAALTAFIEEWKSHQPTVYVLVEGGQVQQAFANEELDLHIYDADLAKVDEAYVQRNGNLEAWQQRIERDIKEMRLRSIEW